MSREAKINKIVPSTGERLETVEPVFSSEKERQIALFTAYLEKIKGRVGEKADKKRKEVELKLAGITGEKADKKEI